MLSPLHFSFKLDFEYQVEIQSLQEKLQIATLHLRPLPCNCLKMVVAAVWSNRRRIFLLNELKGALQFHLRSLPKISFRAFSLSPKTPKSQTHSPHSPPTHSFTSLSPFTNSLLHQLVAVHQLTVLHQLVAVCRSLLPLPRYGFTHSRSHTPNLAHTIDSVSCHSQTLT